MFLLADSLHSGFDVLNRQAGFVKRLTRYSHGSVEARLGA